MEEKKKKTVNCIRQSISRRAGPFPGWARGLLRCCEGEEVNFKLLLRGCRELAKTRFSLRCCKANCLQHPPASSQPATCTHKCNMLMQTAADADDERITPSIPHPIPPAPLPGRFKLRQSDNDTTFFPSLIQGRRRRRKKNLFYFIFSLSFLIWGNLLTGLNEASIDFPLKTFSSFEIFDGSI